eukprot:TRINITY_DN775_c0_g3_i3.p2 TRINITY_DN775_c0_g3~~TRINITY_DN775_c0_g3_i3.p2  ORF type:complete len:192 (-),score=16.78 TRINITY_DN775_c0_g3_i3:485-1060(-)
MLSFLFGLYLSVTVFVTTAYSQLPEDYATLPREIQQQYEEILITKSKQSFDLRKSEVRWGIQAPSNYIYTIERILQPTPPSPYTDPTTILVCGSESNETNLYEEVNNMEKVFSVAAESIESLGELGSSVEIEYDPVYYFPTSLIKTTARIFYDISPSGEILGVAMTGPLESGYIVHEFIALDDSDEACVVV